MEERTLPSKILEPPYHKDGDYKTWWYKTDQGEWNAQMIADALEMTKSSWYKRIKEETWRGKPGKNLFRSKRILVVHDPEDDGNDLWKALSDEPRDHNLEKIVERESAASRREELIMKRMGIKTIADRYLERVRLAKERSKQDGDLSSSEAGGDSDQEKN